MQRFHIKWKSFSHLHNTEETYAFLQERKFKGFKRIDNYIKQIWARENEILTSGRASREDLEAFAIENERVKEVSRAITGREGEEKEGGTNADLESFCSQIQESFKVVERILAQRDGPPNDNYNYHGVEYFCKWNSESAPLFLQLGSAARGR